MNVRSLVLALIAIVIAIGAALGVRTMMAGNSAPQAVAAPPPKAPEKFVLVAVKPLPTGHILTVEDFKWVAWPEDGTDPQFLVKGVDNEGALAGKVVKLAVAQGAPLVRTQLIGPGERGFLAAVLDRSMRAVTVAVTDTSGVGGFVFPGDRVDVVLTHEVPQGAGLPLRGSETILTNVRVLAVNEKTDDTGQVGAIAALRSVTLEVPPRFVETLAVMQRLGSLSLSLRPIAPENDLAAKPKDAAAVPADQAAAASQVAVATGADLAEPVIMPSDKNRTLTVDRDISKLVTMARSATPTQTSGTFSHVAPATTAPKADIVISRAEKNDEVQFVKKTPAGAATFSTPVPHQVEEPPVNVAY
jgi:pilus assembly protein CpaB